MSNEIVQYIRKSYPQYNDWTDDRVTRKWGELYPQYRNEQYYPQFTADYNRSIAPTQQEVQQVVQSPVQEGFEVSAFGGPGRVPDWGGGGFFSNVGGGIATGVQQIDVAGNKLIETVARIVQAKGYAESVAKTTRKKQDQFNKWREEGRLGDEKTWTHKIAAGATSIAPTIYTGLAGGGIRAMGYVAGGQSGFSTLDEAERSYEAKYIAEGMDPEAARERARGDAYAPAIASGLATGLITRGFGATGVEAFAAKETSRVALSDGIKAVGKQIGKGFLAEGLEEGSDEIAQSIIQVNSYNPDLTFKDAASHVFEATIIGGILGGTMHTGRAYMAGRGDAAPAEPLTAPDEDLAPGVEPTTDPGMERQEQIEMERAAQPVTEPDMLPQERIEMERAEAAARVETDPGMEQQAAIEMERAEAPVKSETQQMVEEETQKIAGVVPVFTEGHSNMQVDVDETSNVKVDLAKLDEDTQGMGKAKKRTFIHAALREEAFHNAELQVHYGDWSKLDPKTRPSFPDYVEQQSEVLVNELTADQKAKVEDVYGEKLGTNTQMSMEFNRMLFQEKSGGVTEATWKGIGKTNLEATRSWWQRVIDFLKTKYTGKERTKARRIIKRAEAVLKKLEKAAPKKPATLAEATAYFNKNDPDILTGYYKMSQELIGDERASEGYERAVVAAYNHLQKNDTLKDFKPKQFIGYGKKETHKEKKRRETVIPTEDVPETAATTVEPGLEEARAKVRRAYERAANEMFPDNPELAADMVDVAAGTQKAADVARKHKKSEKTLSRQKQKLIKKAEPYVRKEGFDKTQSVGAARPTKPEGVGEDEKLRRTVERTIPEGHEAEKDPEAWRRSQSLAKGKELVETLTEEELAEYTENPDAFLENYGENFAGLAGIEAYNRASKKAEETGAEEDKSARRAAMVRLSKLGSHVGQLLRQFAELKSSNPEYAARLIANNMEQDGIKLTEDQVATLVENLERIIEAQGAYDVAAVKARKTGTKENLEEAGEAHKALVKAQGDSFSYLSDISPRTFWRTMLQLMQGNLLTPISQTANIVGNTIFLPFRMIGDFANAAIDTVMTKVGLQDPQKQVFTMDWGAYDAAKQGTFEGLAEASQDLLTGTKGDAVKGEVTRGFHPLRRIQQYLTGENLPRTLTEQEELASEAEKVLARMWKNPDFLVDIFPGAPAEAMFRMLTLGDKPFRKGKYRSVLAELASLEGLEGGRKEAFIKHPPAWAHETADEIAARYVFQEKSLPIKMIQKGGKAASRAIESEAGRGASDFAGFLARTQAPYIMTPTNLVRQFMEYVLPPVSAVMGIRNLTRAGKVFKEMQAEQNPGKQRKLLHKYRVLKREGRTKLANAAIGQTMLLAAGQVIAAGLAAGIGRDRRERELMYKTLGPNTLNWSGLKRWLSGGDPRFREGDSGIKFEKLGPLGVVLFIQARKAENMEVAREQAEKRNKEVGTLMSSAYSLMATAGFALEQSFLRGANDLLRAATTPHGVDKWVSNQPTLLMSIAIPNTGMSILRARREFMPEKKGDTGEERVGIAVAEKMQSLTSLFTGKVEPWEMPFGTHAPVKQGAFGKPVLQTPIGANAVWYNMLDITKAAPASADAAEVELYHLFRRTGDRSILPREPQRYFTVNRQKINLDRDQYAVFRTTMGHYQKFFTDQLMGQPYWTNADDDVKIKLIKRAYDSGSELGKDYYVRNYMK